MTRREMWAAINTREYRRIQFYRRQRIAELSEGEGGRTFLVW